MTDKTTNRGSEPTGQELEQLERLALAARRGDGAEAPLGFASRVMARIEDEPAVTQSTGGWISHLVALWRIPVVRLTSGLATAALALWLVKATLQPGTPSDLPNAPGLEAEAGESIPHQFMIEAPTAQRVCLVGDFNDWTVCEVPLVRNEAEGTWSIQMNLPPGRHEYMFVVDEGWVTDPAAELHTDDGFGNRNAVIFL
ncbi:MAG: isoamylase early set domain-containing protein [Candidatus Eisenbacteria bacterium]|nr:isoamylase early set domain-containing protein [Candidatus Eisenbacteria bacterium]